MGDLNGTKQLFTQIGKTNGSVVGRLKDIGTGLTKVETFSSGSLTLDNALDSGYPQGKIIEIFGNEGGGKTLVSLFAIAEVQKSGRDAAFIDMEQTFSAIWAKSLGVDVDNLVFAQPDYGQQALQIVHDLVETGKFGVIVIDSVASLVPKAELDGGMEKQQMGEQARMLGKHIKIITPLANKNKTTLIFINQVRQKIGVMFGNPETTPGGSALKFGAVFRIRVSRVSKSEVKNKDGENIGHTIKFQVKKNKVTPKQGAEAELPIIYTKGVNKVAEYVRLALDQGVIQQNGPMYSFGSQKWKGRIPMETEFEADPKFLKKLEDSVQKPSYNKKAEDKK